MEERPGLVLCWCVPPPPCWGVLCWCVPPPLWGVLRWFMAPLLVGRAVLVHGPPLSGACCVAACPPRWWCLAWVVVMCSVGWGCGCVICLAGAGAVLVCAPLSLLGRAVIVRAPPPWWGVLATTSSSSDQEVQDAIHWQGSHASGIHRGSDLKFETGSETAQRG